MALYNNVEKIATELIAKERKIYKGVSPNVDFYSGILYRAMGIPTNMFTAMFAIGRMPGWIAHWRELSMTPGQKIYRPRQIYTGLVEREFPVLPKSKPGRKK